MNSNSSSRPIGGVTGRRAPGEGWERRIETTRENRGLMKWAAGPWDPEPDRIEWTTDAGFTGIILRQSARHEHYAPGHLCGYVGVEPGHPWHGLDCSTAPAEAHEACHWGITFGRECEGEVCHVPAPGQPEHLWWLGFDAAHCDDMSPRDATLYAPRLTDHTTYRTVEYMRREVERLAAAAKAVTP